MWDISIICIITHVARRTCKIKYRITMAKAEFDKKKKKKKKKRKKKTLFTRQLDLNLRKKLVKC